MVGHYICCQKWIILPVEVLARTCKESESCNKTKSRRIETWHPRHDRHDEDVDQGSAMNGRGVCQGKTEKRCGDGTVNTRDARTDWDVDEAGGGGACWHDQRTRHTTRRLSQSEANQVDRQWWHWVVPDYIRKKNGGI